MEKEEDYLKNTFAKVNSHAECINVIKRLSGGNYSNTDINTAASNRIRELRAQKSGCALNGFTGMLKVVDIPAPTKTSKKFMSFAVDASYGNRLRMEVSWDKRLIKL